MGPDGEESGGSKTSSSHQCCSRMSRLYIITRVFTYFLKSPAIIKWLPSGHLLIFYIWPLKLKCLTAMSRPCRLQQCATCRVARDDNLKKKNNWQLKIGLERIPRWCEMAVPDLHGTHFHHGLVCQPASPRQSPRLFGLRGHNLICSLCVNQVPQCRLAIIGAVSVESSQRFSVLWWILNMAGNPNNSSPLLRSISSSVISSTSFFKTHYFKLFNFCNFCFNIELVLFFFIHETPFKCADIYAILKAMM